MKGKMKKKLLSLAMGTLTAAIVIAVFKASALLFTFTPLYVIATNAATYWPPTNYPPCAVYTIAVPAHTVQVASSNIPTANVSLVIQGGIDNATWPLTLTNFSFANSNDTEILYIPATNITVYYRLGILATNDAYTNQLIGATVIN